MHLVAVSVEYRILRGLVAKTGLPRRTCNFGDEIAQIIFICDCGCELQKYEAGKMAGECIRVLGNYLTAINTKLKLHIIKAMNPLSCWFSNDAFEAGHLQNCKVYRELQAWSLRPWNVLMQPIFFTLFRWPQ